MRDRATARPNPRRTLWGGILLGVGLAGTLDEVILHQLLHWHYLYDRSSRAAGLVSDGLFHLASTALLAVGLIPLFGYAASSYSGRRRRAVAATLIGLGGFNLYDGTIQHKLLRIHQVRPAAGNWLPYDAAFIGTAAVILVAGIALLRTANTSSVPQPDRYS